MVVEEDLDWGRGEVKTMPVRARSAARKGELRRIFREMVWSLALSVHKMCLHGIDTWDSAAGDNPNGGVIYTVRTDAGISTRDCLYTSTSRYSGACRLQEGEARARQNLPGAWRSALGGMHSRARLKSIVHFTCFNGPNQRRLTLQSEECYVCPISSGVI